ncbi:MAG: hypothetical protein AAFY20_03215 [Cyanobacteria bacterium J06639_14]
MGNHTFCTSSGPEAGIYEAVQEYNETEAYKPNAEIREVWAMNRDCG